MEIDSSKNNSKNNATDDLNNDSVDDSKLNSEPIKKIKWQEHHENILVDWTDKALCYKWLHSKSYVKYSYLSKWYTLPVIIMSTLTGTANFAIERIPEEYRGIAQISIGSINLLAGIITTVAQFLKLNELCESHRVSYISWDKFYRNIRVELAKAPIERIEVIYLIKSCKDEFDRLTETSPTIDSNILSSFNKQFSETNKKTVQEINNRRDNYNNLNKPEILELNTLKSSTNIIYVDKSSGKDLIIDIIKDKTKQLEKDKKIQKFIINFEKEYARLPYEDEIYNNLESHINRTYLNQYLSSDKWLKLIKTQK